MSFYRFKAGTMVRADPQEAGKVCEQLAQENNLTAKSLVNVSRPEDAPLHSAFEWNDAVAAESWREEQARHIIAGLEIVTEEHPPVKAYFNLERSEPTYRHIETIMQDRDDREKLLRNARLELAAFQKKYSSLKELASVFAAITALDVA